MAIKRNNRQQDFLSSKLFQKYAALFTTTLFLFILCFFFSHLDETITAEGEIRPLENETSIKCLFSGTVTNIHYKNSAFIHKGDLLFELDSSYEEEQLNNAEELRNLYSTETKEF